MDTSVYAGQLGYSLSAQISHLCDSRHHVSSQSDYISHCKDGLQKIGGSANHWITPTSVTVTMVPLVGLGSDQVKSGSNEENLIKAYHLDIHRGDDGKALRDRLLLLSDNEANHVSILLYASPKSL